jgi:antirestriction protein
MPIPPVMPPPDDTNWIIASLSAIGLYVTTLFGINRAAIGAARKEHAQNYMDALAKMSTVSSHLDALQDEVRGKLERINNQITQWRVEDARTLVNKDDFERMRVEIKDGFEAVRSDTRSDRALSVQDSDRRFADIQRQLGEVAPRRAVHER